MPKVAATLASLLLIASSIGVNIARYPQVGRSVDAGQRPDAIEPANSAPAQQQANVVEPATPNPLPTSKAEIEPAKPRQAAAVPVAENLQAEESNTSQPIADTAQLKSTGLVPILGVRPMAPIVGTQPAVDSLGMPVDIDAVRRLPPVDPSVPTAADYQPGEMDKAATAYPATSTP